MRVTPEHIDRRAKLGHTRIECRCVSCIDIEIEGRVRESGSLERIGSYVPIQPLNQT